MINSAGGAVERVDLDERAFDVSSRLGAHEPASPAPRRRARRPDRHSCLPALKATGCIARWATSQQAAADRAIRCTSWLTTVQALELHATDRLRAHTRMPSAHRGHPRGSIWRPMRAAQPGPCFSTTSRRQHHCKGEQMFGRVVRWRGDATRRTSGAASARSPQVMRGSQTGVPVSYRRAGRRWYAPRASAGERLLAGGAGGVSSAGRLP